MRLAMPREPATSTETTADEIGPQHIEQCVRSIRAFRDAGVRAKRYLLVHNRDGRNAELRAAVETELRLLVASGQVAAARRVEAAGLWPPAGAAGRARHRL